MIESKRKKPFSRQAQPRWLEKQQRVSEERWKEIESGIVALKRSLTRQRDHFKLENCLDGKPHEKEHDERSEYSQVQKGYRLPEYWI